VIGSVVAGKYRIVRELGKGGMGAVYEAVHVSTAKRVALKVIRAREDGDEKGTAQILRFQREAIAVGRLETQHVVQVYDAGTDEATKQPFLVMELLEGEDVSQLIRRIGPLRQELALSIIAQACAGLQKAHDAGVVHRDIKPSNLFLARNEYGEFTLKILDFGIAKVAKSDDTVNDAGGTITETGTLVGSPHYMSPEQAKGLKTVDARADLWSLGVVLHKCLSGRTPFDGYSTLGQVIVAVCSEDPVSVQEHAPWVRPELSQVLRHAMRRDPGHRYQTAMSMLEAIRPFLPAGPRITADLLQPLSTQELGNVMPRRSDFPTQLTPPSGTLPGAITTPSGAWLASASGPSGTPQPGSMPSGQLQRTVSMTPHQTHSPTGPFPVVGRPGSPSSPSMTRGSFVTTSDEIPPKKPRRKWPFVLVALGGLAAGGVFAYPKLHLVHVDKPAEAAPPTTQPEEPKTADTSAPAAPPTAKQTVKVGITPANATVDVDGTPAKAESGFVTIEGAPGSVHKVKITQGGRDASFDVVLTDKGAYPSKVALPAAGAAVIAKPTPATPVTKPAAPTPTTKPTGTSTGSKSGFDSRFE